MQNKYLITGLPRSRTAWMAAFMGCPHEPTGAMDTLSDVEKFYRTHDGCSDSGLGWWLPWILHNIAPRVVIIHRPLLEVEESLQREFPEYPRTNYCAQLRNTLKMCWDHPLVLNVPFHALGDMATMRRVFWHLRPGQPFDEGRYRSMNRQRIVVDKNRLTLTGKLLLLPSADCALV